MNRIKEYFSKNKVMALFPILFLAMVIPVLILGISRSLEIRSNAAGGVCTIFSPCTGYIGVITNTATGVRYFYFQNMTLKSLNNTNFNNYLSGQVAITGNIITEGAEKSLYVSTIRYSSPKTPTPACPLVSQNCGPGNCGDQSLGAYYCQVGSRCMVNSCYPIKRVCTVDASCPRYDPPPSPPIEGP